MNLQRAAEQALALARKHGAQQAAATASSRRDIQVTHRDGKLEKMSESASARVTLEVFVEGRYASHSTSDVRPEVMATFIERAVKLTRALGPDPHRGLADPKWYRGLAKGDLGIHDDAYPQVTTAKRQAVAKAVEEATRTVGGPVVSATGSYSDQALRTVRLHSNGLEASHRETSFWASALATVADTDGRKPNASAWAGSRLANGLPQPETIGQEAARRAIARCGQVTLPTGPQTIVVENRSGRRLLAHMLRPLRGAALQQKRSFWLDKAGQKVASGALTLRDEPLLPGGLASRAYDEDGIAAKPRVLFEQGVLRSYLIDVYYARKLGVEPTGGSTSNLELGLGTLGLEEILATVGNGLYITGFQGGNSDGTRGDFSHGVSGFAIRDGKLAEPVGAMNIAGNHTELWHRLAMVGNDPFPYSAWRLPTLVFDRVTVSGA